MVAVPVQQSNRITMSRAEYDHLPEGPPYYDYLKGMAIEVNRPSVKHQRIMFRMSNILWEHTEANDLGLIAPDVDVALPTGDVVAPDVVFLSKERIELYNETKGDIYGTPDLVVEIHSPSTWNYDRLEKLAVYQQAGVPWVWFVEQESGGIEELEWTERGYLLVGGESPGKLFQPKLFPGLEFNLKELAGL